MAPSAAPPTSPESRRGGARAGLALGLSALFAGGCLLGLAKVRPDLAERLWQRLVAPAPPRVADAGAPQADALPEGWVRVHVGGAPSTEGREPASRAPTSAGSSSSGSDFVLVVQPGQTLRRIASEHYRRDDMRLLEALAAYNELPDANSLPAGKRLRLPDLERLEGL